jgi:hypothetical protein
MKIHTRDINHGLGDEDQHTALSYIGGTVLPWSRQEPAQVNGVVQKAVICLMQLLPKDIYRSFYLCMAVQPFVGPWLLFSFLILYTIGITPWTGDQPVARPLPTHRTQTQNELTQTSMLWVKFEPKMPAFERAKKVYDWKIPLFPPQQGENPTRVLK